jgi:hypothetical protein
MMLPPKVEGACAVAAVAVLLVVEALASAVAGLALACPTWEACRGHRCRCPDQLLKCR